MSLDILDMEDIGAIAQALLDKGASIGVFETFTGHEPKSTPGNQGLHLALFGASMAPVPDLSGLASASVRVEFQFRIMRDMLTEPQDQIDPETMGATGRLMNALAGGYTLGGQVHAVDVLGAYGESLRAQAGYLSIGGGQGGQGRMYRVMEVFCPVVINDCWTYGE